MKLFLSLAQMREMTTAEREFIDLWRTRKGYNNAEPLSLGECLELLIATSRNMHKDWSDSRFFNNIMTNKESLLAWDGEELIDILWYEARQQIKKLMAKTYSEPEGVSTN